MFSLSCQIPYNLLFPQVGSFLRWIHESSSQLKERSFEQSSKVWSGREIVGAMEKQGITAATFKIYSVSGFLFPFLYSFKLFLESLHCRTHVQGAFDDFLFFNPEISLVFN